METKEVVEKRIKPGIIRRRARKSKPETVETSAVEAQAQETLEKAQEIVPVEAPATLKETKETKPPQKTKTEPAEKEKTPRKKKASAKKEAEPQEEAIEKTSVEAKAPEPTVSETPPPSKPEANRVLGPKELPEGPPVGTIIELPHMKKKEEALEDQKIKVKSGKTAEEEEEESKLKSKRPTKRPKVVDETLDVEGFGRVKDVSQIARISARSVTASRVFQPTRVGGRRRARSKRDAKKTLMTERKAAKRIVKMEEVITVSDLAQQMGVKGSEIIKQLMDLGTMVTLNQSVDHETAIVVAQEYGWEVKKTAFEEEKVLQTDEDKAEELQSRAPVVTVMGHVDHGKTSLLDAIRQTQVAEGEAGGITQHIGSYRIHLGEGKDITFLDTPGHEAFTAMRARGASVTDIVILVVAADDGVMPQTIEAINHSKAAEVPIIVAINKIDKTEAKPDEIKRQLSEHSLLAEDWGGDTIMVPVSAKSKQGIDNLLEMVFLQAEVLELKANPNKPAKGVIVEAQLDKGRGPVATALIQEGTLRVGDSVVAGNFFGRIRAMMNDRGENVDVAGPSFPVEILGLEGVPHASEGIQALSDEKAARQVVDHRQLKARETKLGTASKMSLEDLFDKMKTGEIKELGVILKADVQGSLEALEAAFQKLPSDKVKIRILHAAVGGVTESDVMLAEASNGIIIGFNVRPDTKARELAEKEGVQVNDYKVIYEVIDDVKKAMEGLLEPTLKEKYLGRAEVRQAFTVSKVGTIAGSYVVDGKIVANANVRLLRDNVIIHEGKLSSLKRFKEDAKEVAQNYECGMGIDSYNDIKEGDVIECYQIESIKTKLE